MEQQFQERIARAKEAARLASIAALARATSNGPPPPLPPLPSLLPHFASGAPRVPPPAPEVRRPVNPPDEVRHRIDRLVEFIGRNGPAFEETARARERENPDFAFLHAGAPFHEYFVWKKAQLLPPPSHVEPPPLQPPRPLASTTPLYQDPVMDLSVGAMASACKLARSRGLPPYAPLPPDLLTLSTTIAPPMEPARLDARLAEYYNPL